MTFDIQSYLSRCQQRVDLVLEKTLPQSDDKLHQAMRYMALKGGKRLRPALVYAVGDLFNIDQQVLDHMSCTLELIHCYSLIHDDLPAMDDDDFRRGQPSCHKVFGEAIAILAGDALQTLAFEVLSRPLPLQPAKQIAMIQRLTQAIGSLGMANGQALDIIGGPYDVAKIEQIYHQKTSLLIKCCVELPMIVAIGVKNDNYLTSLMQYGDCLGLAFQIHDDILDSKTVTDVKQKNIANLVENCKDLAKLSTDELNYVAIVGLQQAKEKRQQLYQQAMEALLVLGLQQSTLASLADYMVTRDI